VSVEVNAGEGGGAAVKESTGPMGRVRGRTLGIALAVVVATSAASFAIGSRIKSPAEIAARTAPPAASLITAPVEQRTLSADVVVRGTVRYGAPQAVALPVSGLKKGSRVLTTAPSKGAQLNESDVAMTLSGRPVLVLQGQRPAYRDLTAGVSGDDVRQLQAALNRLGFYHGAVNGTYDQATASAVAAWYLKAGYVAQGMTDEQIAALRTFQSEQYTANTDVMTARESLLTAQNGLASARDKAAAANVTAQEAAKAAIAAQAKFELDRKAAQADVASKTTNLNAATAMERDARKHQSDLQAQQPPASQADLQAANDAVVAATQALDQARGDLTASQAALAAVVLIPDAAKAAAQAKSDATLADADVTRAAQLVPLAQSRLALATGRSGAIVTPPGVGKFTVQVPADEVLYFPTLPVRIDDVKLKAGDEANGQVMTVTNSRLVVDSFLSPEDARSVLKDATVAIKASDQNINATGKVTNVATQPGTNGAPDPTKFYVEITPNDAPASLVGASVILTIAVQSTDTAVLAVPVNALSVAADGTSRVQVQGADHSLRSVTVTPGLKAKGFVAVTPTSGSLKPGDLVVVGNSNSTTATVPATTTTGSSTTTTTTTTTGGSSGK
jgi:peptidoglycan hydrolase-like protein with peptidoglycan-binding domain